MISHQELSAPQVCSYLMDYGDHYTSHEYKNLYWTAFEKFINDENPSPECYPSTFVTNPGIQDPEVVSSSQINQTCNNIDNEVDILESEEDNQFNINEQVYEDEHKIANNEEVIIAVEPTGKLIAHCSQVLDYQQHSSRLSDLCLWDSISQVEKIRRIK